MLKKTILLSIIFLIIVLTLRYFKNSEKLNISETNNLNQKEKVEILPKDLNKVKDYIMDRV